MAPKKVVKKVKDTYTLQEAIDFYEKQLKNPDSTKTIVKNSLVNLVYWWKGLNDNVEYSNKTNAELMDDATFMNYDIYELLNNPKQTIDVIENKIKIKRTGEPIAIDTIKQIYTSIVYLNTKKTNRINLDDEVWNEYDKKFKEYNDLSNIKRRQNVAGGNLKDAPHIDWNYIKDKYNEFLKNNIYKKNKFTSKQDLKNLRHATLLGFYILQTPRRITDYYTLQYYSSKPDDKDIKGKNIVVVDIKNKTAHIYIDDFKIRYMTRNNITKEVMPRYETKLTDDLTNLLIMYIQAHQIKDMSKLTAQEKKNNAEYYVFYQELGINFNKYSNASSFSDHIKTASKKIVEAPLTANDYRHSFQTDIMNNINEYTDQQLFQISTDAGDKPKDLATNLRYRIANPMNKGLNVNEINEMIDLKKQILKPQEDGGSIGNIDDDVISPQHNDDPKTDIDTLVDNFITALKPLLYHLLKK